MAAFWMWSSLLTLVGLTVAHVHAQALTATPLLGLVQRQQLCIPLCRFNALRHYPAMDDQEGGSDGCGTVFSVPLSGGSPTVLASFNDSDGEAPFACLTLSGNTLDGTTEKPPRRCQWVGHGLQRSPYWRQIPTVLASFYGSSNGKFPVAGFDAQR